MDEFQGGDILVGAHREKQGVIWHEIRSQSASWRGHGELGRDCEAPEAASCFHMTGKARRGILVRGRTGKGRKCSGAENSVIRSH